jgi:DNA polymerase I-like protein with 3'-5' exonuclease and polymerase domains
MMVSHEPTFLCKNWDAFEVRELLREIHLREDVTVVWHNAAFDLSVLVKNGWLSLDEINPIRFADTLLMSYLLNPVKIRENGDHKLKHLYDAHLREPGEPPQPTYEDMTKGRDYEDISVDVAGFYSAFDSYSTYHLYQRVLLPEMEKDKKLSRYYQEIELPHLLTTVELMTTGLRLLGQSELNVQGLLTLPEISAALEVQKLKVFRLTGATFNFDSPDALRGVLLSRCGIRSKDWNQKSRKVKIDATTLAKMYRSERRQENKKILAHVMYAKRLTEIVKKHREMYKYVDAITNREYASFRPTTASGRYAVSQPNLLSLPRVTKIKQYLVSDPGKVFIIADFSQIDLRAIANETWEIDQRSKMLASVNQGDDLHTSTLRIVCPDLKFPEDWVKLYEDKEKSEFGVHVRSSDGTLVKMALNPEKRNLWEQIEIARKEIAKQVNFGISYGLSDEGLLDALNNPKEFKDGLIGLATQDGEDADWLEYMTKFEPATYSVEQVQGFLEKFHNAYPGIRQFQNLVEKDLCASGLTYNLFGKLCRAETIRFMNAGVFDVALGFNNWYRVRIKTLKIDGKFVYGLLLKVNELEIIEPRSRGTAELKDLIRIEGYQVYSINAANVESALERYLQSGDVAELLRALNEIHNEANWAGSRFLKRVSATEPFWNGQELTHIPSFPFIKLTHYQIKFVWNDEHTDSFVYQTFSKLNRMLVSARIQSASMDFCKIAMFTFRNKAREKWPDLEARPRIVNCIHDEIAVECHESQKDDVKELLSKCMSDKENFRMYIADGRALEVNIEAEVKIGINYKGDKK